MRRPALTKKRVAALELIAQELRPKLALRAADGLFVLPRVQRRAMKPAMDYLDGLAAWDKNRRQAPAPEGPTP